VTSVTVPVTAKAIKVAKGWQDPPFQLGCWSNSMSDLAMLLLSALFFLMALAYTWACDKLR